MAELTLESSHGEFSAWAGRLARYAAMAHDVVVRDTTLGHQEVHQPAERSHLRATGSILLKVADQADSDPMLVETVARNLAMGAPFLLDPARAHFDHPVARVRTVADDKMVSQLIPLVHLAMVSASMAGLRTRASADTPVAYNSMVRTTSAYLRKGCVIRMNRKHMRIVAPHLFSFWI